MSHLTLLVKYIKKRWHFHDVMTLPHICSFLYKEGKYINEIMRKFRNFHIHKNNKESLGVYMH